MSECEYVWNKSNKIIDPICVFNMAPENCKEFDSEFGKFCVWYYRLDHETILSSSKKVEKLVADEKFKWLDWLSKNGFVTKKEIACENLSKITPENIWLEYSKDGASAHLMTKDDKGQTKCLIEITPNKYGFWFLLHLRILYKFFCEVKSK